MSPECPPRSLRGCHWFLTGISGVLLNTKLFNMPRGMFIRSLKFLAVVEVSPPLGVSKVSSKESKRMSLVPDWSQTLRNVFDLHRGNSMQIFKS